jgi:GcrA cell cycle regulator
MSWTDERVELLKKLWADGLSASQIAAELGGITRNAVIGKVHRLGLSGRAKSPSSSSPRPRKARSHPHMLRVSRPMMRGNTALSHAYDYDVEPEPELLDNVIPIACPIAPITLVSPISRRTFAGTAARHSAADSSQADFPKRSSSA